MDQMKIFVSILGLTMLFSILFIPVYSDDLIILGNGHAPFYVSNTDSARFDFDNDGTTDYYVKAHYTGNSNQQLKIDYKLQDECVDLGPKDPSDVGGDTFDDAALKIGFSSLSNSPRQWFVDDIEVWNPWFKSKHNDDNKLIDLAFVSPFVSPFFDDDHLGDDVIQGNGKHGSFQHLSSITELDGQSGWTGSIFLNALVGEYRLWTIHPSDGFGGCDGLTGLGIPILITK
ncbi:conserved exported hypothetical protein [metagenome]